MTTDEINALTDEQLVAAAGMRIMGWHLWPKSCDDDRHRIDGSAVRCRLANGSDKLWEPLKDWNDCWQVVEAMRAKGYTWELDDQLKAIHIASETGEWTSVGYGGNERRAILRTALMAMENAK